MLESQVRPFLRPESGDAIKSSSQKSLHTSIVTRIMINILIIIFYNRPNFGHNIKRNILQNVSPE